MSTHRERQIHLSANMVIMLMNLLCPEKIGYRGRSFLCELYIAILYRKIMLISYNTLYCIMFIYMLLMKNLTSLQQTIAVKIQCILRHIRL